MVEADFGGSPEPRFLSGVSLGEKMVVEADLVDFGGRPGPHFLSEVSFGEELMVDAALVDFGGRPGPRFLAGVACDSTESTSSLSLFLLDPKPDKAC